MKTALIAGATGLVGKQCLYQLLESDQYSKVIALVRKPLNIKNTKLTEVVVDFNQLTNYTAQMVADDVYCCLGTTIGKAGSQEAFKLVDYTYNFEVANISKSNGAKQLLLVSALGADSKSPIFYNRVKGELEDAVALLGYESVHCFRPSLLLGNRNEFRFGELIAKWIMRLIGFMFIGPIKRYKAIQAVDVAKSMLKHAARNVKRIVVVMNEMMF